jgi:hypothetical protein
MEITNNHRALFSSYVAKYTALGLTTQPTAEFNRPAAVAAVRQLFKVAGKAVPKNIFIGQWPECVAEAKRIQSLTHKPSDISSALSWGQFSAGSACYAKFFVDELGSDELAEKAQALYDIAACTGPSLFFGEAAFIAVHPEVIEDDPADKDKLKLTWGEPCGAWDVTEGPDIQTMIDRLEAANRPGGKASKPKVTPKAR